MSCYFVLSNIINNLKNKITMDDRISALKITNTSQQLLMHHRILEISRNKQFSL